MKHLNLKPHVCGANKKKTKVLCSAADIEGHLGKDGKVCEEGNPRQPKPNRKSKKIKIQNSNQPLPPPKK